MKQGIERFNALPREAAESELMKCCGSTKWAQAVSSARPFGDMNELLAAADRIWWALDSTDWLEAFSHHPQIGERKSERPQAAEASRWSEQEQSGTRNADSETRAALVAGNHAYLQKFGYIFIVCATGKSSGEMLALLEARLSNDPDTELRIAAEEQRRITHLRLRKMLESVNSSQ